MKKSEPDADFMRRAIAEAQLGGITGNYQVGAVVVTGDGQIVSVAHTELHDRCDPTAHAEILALRAATEARGSKYLEDCYLYSTLEPCPMCASAAIWAKLAGLVFGATLEDALDFASRADARFTWRQIKIKAQHVVDAGTPKLTVRSGFLREECVRLLREQVASAR
jgi:tRNA(Arg) A34 adenosine deaminase TadA